MNKNVNIDISKVTKMLQDVNLEKHKDDTRKMIDEATAMIYVQAQKNLRNTLHSSGKNKYGLSLSSGITRKIWKNDKGGSVYVNQNGNYIVYMHAKGTKARYTKGKNGKRKAYRGKLSAKTFFQDAVNSTKNIVLSLLQKRITEMLNRIKNK